MASNVAVRGLRREPAYARAELRTRMSSRGRAIGGNITPPRPRILLFRSRRPTATCPSRRTAAQSPIFAFHLLAAISLLAPGTIACTAARPRAPAAGAALAQYQRGAKMVYVPAGPFLMGCTTTLGELSRWTGSGCTGMM